MCVCVGGGGGRGHFRLLWGPQLDGLWEGAVSGYFGGFVWLMEKGGGGGGGRRIWLVWGLRVVSGEGAGWRVRLVWKGSGACLVS